MARYRFNGRTLDSGTRRITGPDGAVHLPPKPYEILIELLRQPGQLVTRESLLESIWPERPASDETLSRTIADLRKYLNDDPRAPRFIETVPKVGYRFVARLEPDRSVATRSVAWLAGTALVTAAAVAIFLVLRHSVPGDPPASRGGILQQPVPVTTEVGDEDTPDFSPDGRLVVYAARKAGGDDWNIRIRDLASGQVRDVVTHPDRDYAPTFAPDGQHIAFRRYRGEHCEIIIKPLEGAERPLARCRTPMMGYLDWSPDGREIAYSDTGEEGSMIMLKAVDVVTGRARRLLEPADPQAHRFAPRYSPSGTRLAFLQGTFDRNELWIADLGDGRLDQVTRTGGWIGGVTWNGDGSALYFTTVRPEFALWRVDPGKSPERLGSITGYLPAYDPVNGRLVFDNIQRRTNIWSVERDVAGRWGEPVRRIASTRIDNSPSLSPDGSRVAFASDRSGAWEIWLAGIDGADPRKVTDWQAEAIDRPDWSPDGNTLAYSVLRDGRWTSYLHHLDDDHWKPLAAWSRTSRHPVFSDDGAWVIYAAPDGVHRVALDAGRDEYLVKQSGATPLFSLDGTLYFLRPDRPGIHRFGSDRSAPLLTQFDLVVPAAIDEGGGELFFVATSPGDGVRRVHAFDPASGTLQPIHPVISDTRQSHVSASRDGRLVLFSQTEDAHSDIQLIEALP